MSKESKKTLGVAEVNKTAEAGFEERAGELRADIPRIAVDFNEKILELDFVENEKENSKIRYRRKLDEGDSEAMDLCLKEIRAKNVRVQELKAELSIFPAQVKKLYDRQTEISTVARDGQATAAAGLREAEKALKSTEAQVNYCYGLMGQINGLNKSIEETIRAQKKSKEDSEAEIKIPRSNKDGFWLEVADPFARGELRHYQKLKDVDGLSLPLILNFKDKERVPVDGEGLKNRFEKSESLKAEFGDLKTYIEFEGLVVVQVLKSYVIRANGGGDRRRGFSAQAALAKCR